MSDSISIPGTSTDKYGTANIVAGLMKVERIPLEKANERLKVLETEKSVWLDLNRKLGALRDDARGLYSFRNPFNQRVATSSDEGVLTASATREAIESTTSILVKRAATADRFLSAELDKSRRVPAGTYGFKVGDKSLSLKWTGGSIQEFVDALTRRGTGLVRAQLMALKPDTRSLLIESLKTGSTNRLSFEGDSVKLAVELGLVEETATRGRDLDPTRIVAWDRPIDRRAVKTEDGVLSLSTGGEAKIPIQPPVSAAGMVLEFEYRIARIPRPEAPAPPPGPAVGSSGSVSFEGITIEGAPSATALPDWVAPVMPPVVEDKAMASLVSPDGSVVALAELQDGEGVRSFRVELDGLLSEAAGLAFRVRDTTRRLEVLSAAVVDPKETGGYRPLRAISTAQDAIVVVEGIEAERPTNDISDLVPGVTLNVKSASDKSVRLKVEPDRLSVTEAVIAFVGNYNRLMSQINILSQRDERLVSEIAYFTEDERKTALERLGILQGDSTLSLLRSALQRAVTNPYETGAGAEMALLAQIGVASDARRPGSGQGYDVTKLRGYLEIDEDSLEKALTERFDAVRQLFGSDTDGDLVVNSGIAYALDTLLKPYVETGGILSLKTGTIDTKISSEKRGISTLEEKLAVKEAELKRKYGLMSSSLSNMESTSNSIDRAFGQGTKP